VTKGNYWLSAAEPSDVCAQSKRNSFGRNPLKILALFMDLKIVDCNRSMSSNPIASAIFGTDKALIIQGFVVSGIWEFYPSISESFPHLFGHFRNPTLLTLLDWR
jgi:hypothetical protein